jgi:hypothetical protein
MRFSVAAILIALPSAALAEEIKGTIKLALPPGWTPKGIKIVHQDGPQCCRAGKAPAETSPCAGGKDLPDDSLIVAKDGGLANVVVYLTKAPAGGKRDWSFLTKQLKQEIVDAKANPPVMGFDQKFCRFTPHILLVPAGWRVQVFNSDPFAHNTHSFPFKNEPFNIIVGQAQLDGNGGVAKRGELPVLGTDKTELGEVAVKIVCDVHTWMNAYWAVMEHPYCTLTDEHGNFRIDQVPPGSYFLKTWHEKFGNRHAGPKGIEVTVKPGETTEVKGFAELKAP